MYRKFLENKDLMNLLNWLLEHSMGEYSADNIQLFTEIYNPEKFIKLLHLLYTLGICDVNADEEVEELYVSLNSDSELVKAFNFIRNEIELKSYETMEVEDVLNDEEDYSIESYIEKLINDTSIDLDKFIVQCKNYETFLENKDEYGFNKQIYKRLKELDEQGELELFIEFLEDIKEMRAK